MSEPRRANAPSIDASIADRARRLAKRDRESLSGPEGPRPTPAPTLSHFDREGVPVRIECDACRHKVDRPAAHWMGRFGDVTLAEVERRARCSACGERELVDARPLYASGAF